MTVGSEEKDVLDAGANPAISTNKIFELNCNLFYTEREWNRAVGWGLPEGMNSFDNASSNRADSPKDD